uniref:Uncharacterized protein n=1 Tax=Nicotiana tabacum TaxID=4097 RepID=A0A1S3YGY0_TOBAC|nr:PREDICTED: uncharacterized protein LOC107775914 [Nicotiana tabacum]
MVASSRSCHCVHCFASSSSTHAASHGCVYSSSKGPKDPITAVRHGCVSKLFKRAQDLVVLLPVVSSSPLVVATVFFFRSSPVCCFFFSDVVAAFLHFSRCCHASFFVLFQTTKLLSVRVRRRFDPVHYSESFQHMY